jgi:hypothetical protein
MSRVEYARVPSSIFVEPANTISLAVNVAKSIVTRGSAEPIQYYYISIVANTPRGNGNIDESTCANDGRSGPRGQSAFFDAANRRTDRENSIS